jgi:hypothetical protein
MAQTYTERLFNIGLEAGQSIILFMKGKDYHRLNEFLGERYFNALVRINGQVKVLIPTGKVIELGDLKSHSLAAIADYLNNPQDGKFKAIGLNSSH